MSNVHQFPFKGQRRRRRATKAFNARSQAFKTRGTSARKGAEKAMATHPAAVFYGLMTVGTLSVPATRSAVRYQARRYEKKQEARSSNPQGSRRGGGGRGGRQRRDSHGRFA